MTLLIIVGVLSFLGGILTAFQINIIKNSAQIRRSATQILKNSETIRRNSERASEARYK